MKKLKKTLQALTAIAVLPKAYREELESTLDDNMDALRDLGQYYACLLLSELEDCGLNLLYIFCDLHQRFAAKQFREMHLLLMMLLLCIGKKPSRQFVEVAAFEDRLAALMEEMLDCFDSYLLAEEDMEAEDDGWD